MSLLFEPLTLGALRLPNRVVMAPMTRNRSSGPGRVPNAMMRDYYTQRAQAGLIISEATAVSPAGVGYLRSPGIWSAEQVEGWRSVVDGVHAAGGRMFLQLWHAGRVSDPSLLDGALPVAPSAVALPGTVSLLRPKRPYVVPRPLPMSELPLVIEAFRAGAENAKRAGFDGVELHAANGYLLDQFLEDGSNRRTDEYGGAVQNRARLLLEVTDAVVSVWGRGRVGVHLSPRGDAQIEGDSDPAATFGYVAKELGRREVAFLCLRESLVGARFTPALKAAFGGVVIANEGFDRASAEALVASGEVDAVAFGKPFISNPNLPARFQEGRDLAPWHEDTFYEDGPHGYVDYPA